MLAETNTFVKQIAKLVVKKTENGFRDMIRGRRNFCSSGFLRGKMQTARKILR